MIKWREEMSVGHPLIDGDHKKLIEIINDFERTVALWPSEKVLHEVLIRLQDYVNEHFSREEAIQRECRYPLYEEHKREHDALLMKVTEFAQTYFIKRTRPVDKRSLADMARFLREWFSDHTIRADIKMKDYIDRAFVDPIEHVSVNRPAA